MLEVVFYWISGGREQAGAAGGEAGEAVLLPVRVHSS